MQKLLAFAAGTLLLFGASDIASADPVSFQDQAQQTETAQHFQFWFDPTPQGKTGQDGYFIIWARGDYSPGNWEEYLSWTIEGVIGDNFSGPAYAGHTISTDGFNDTFWFQQYVIPELQLSQILGDGEVHIDVLLSRHVNQPLFDNRTQEWIDNGQAGVHVGIFYDTQAPLHELIRAGRIDLDHYVPVPEPSLLALVGLGGLIALRRRRKQKLQKQS